MRSILCASPFFANNQTTHAMQQAILATSIKNCKTKCKSIYHLSPSTIKTK